jgi:uncharacterized membrane protein YbhN (UPF0104 family)
MTRRFNRNLAILIQIFSWSFGLLIAALLITRIDINVLKQAFKEAELIPFIILIGFFSFFWMFCESYNLFIIIKKYAIKPSYYHITILRAVTYLLMLINYNLGIGGILAGLSYKHGLSIKNSTTIIIIYSIVDLLSLSLLTLASTTIAIETMPSNIFKSLFYLSLFIIVMIVIVYLFCINIITFKKFLPIWVYKFVIIIKNEILEITKKDFLIFLSIRSFYFFTFALFFYFSIPLFHFYIPLVDIIALLPPIFFLGNLPITPAGIGTIQAAMLFFFKDYGDYAKILLYSLSYTTLLIIFRLIIGFMGLLFFNKNKYPFVGIDK